MLCILWLAFVGLWIRVAQYTTFHELLDSLRLLLIMSLAYSLVLVTWVLHNISIYKRKGPRKQNCDLELFPDHDYMGATVDLRVDCQSEPEIVIDLLEGTKYYLPKEASSGEVLRPVAHAISDRARENEESIRRGTRDL